LEKHSAKGHKNGGMAKLYNCDECNVKFSFMRTLRRHQRSVHVVVPANGESVTENGEPVPGIGSHAKKWPCDLCDKSFSTVSYLGKHRLIVHQKTREFKCRFCQKEFGSTSGIFLNFILFF
jgi:uncharacterized Zn-finger protein